MAQQKYVAIIFHNKKKCFLGGIFFFFVQSVDSADKYS